MSSSHISRGSRAKNYANAPPKKKCNITVFDTEKRKLIFNTFSKNISKCELYITRWGRAAKKTPSQRVLKSENQYEFWCFCDRFWPSKCRRNGVTHSATGPVQTPWVKDMTGLDTLTPSNYIILAWRREGYDGVSYPNTLKLYYIILYYTILYYIVLY